MLNKPEEGQGEAPEPDVQDAPVKPVKQTPPARGRKRT